MPNKKGRKKDKKRKKKKKKKRRSKLEDGELIKALKFYSILFSIYLFIYYLLISSALFYCFSFLGQLPAILIMAMLEKITLPLSLARGSNTIHKIN